MDPESTGFGQTMAEIRAMPGLPLPDLMAYCDAVRAVTRRYLDQATGFLSVCWLWWMAGYRGVNVRLDRILQKVCSVLLVLSVLLLSLFLSGCPVKKFFFPFIH